MQNNDSNSATTDNTPVPDPAVQAGLDWAVSVVRGALNSDIKRKS